ncbi:MAG: hypothetical protein KGJ86_03635 [Chloroflexota bacterium]|nr:hypothetical protein [Chloroflexota bacterium]
MKLRVWSEFLPYRELGQPAVLRLLRAFDCGLLVQVRQQSLGKELAELLHRSREEGVEAGLWLLLTEDQGYWPSERNAGLFRDYLTRVLEWRAPAWIAVDLEPPLWQMRARGRRGLAGLPDWLRFARDNISPRRFEAAHQTFGEVIQLAHAAGTKVLCAAHDYLAEDLWLGRPAMQDLHEAPVLGLPWDAISVMLYGSLVPRCPRRWLYETARLLGPGMGASVGLTGAGVLGNEPHYTEPWQLALDMSALKAAGMQDFAIYNLEGILESPAPESWLQAAVAAEARAPRPSWWVTRERAKRRVLAAVVAAWRSIRSVE